MKIGQLIRDIRTADRIKLDDLAERVGLSSSTISRIERTEDNKLSLAEADSIFKALGLPLELVTLCFKPLEEIVPEDATPAHAHGERAEGSEGGSQAPTSRQEKSRVGTYSVNTR